MGRAEEFDIRAWSAAAGAIMGAFMAFLDIQIVNSSLANIEGAVTASPSEGSWISTSYLIGEIVTMPLSVWLSSVFGTRRYLVWSSVLFVLFSVSCASSVSLSGLAISRALQGLAAGAAIPGALTIVATRLPASQRPIGVAFFGLTVTLTPALGPTLGGWLTENWGWPYLFLVNIGPGAVTVALLLFGLDQEELRLRELRYGDWPGIALTSIALSFAIVVLEEGTRLEWLESPLIRGLIVVATVAFLGAIARELTAARPFINLRLLGRRSVGGACFVIFFMGANQFGVLFIIPTYLAQVNGYNAQQIGSLLVWMTLPQLVMFPLTAYLMKYVDPRLMMVVGVLGFGASSFLNSRLNHLVGIDQLIVPQLLSAFGQPILGVTMQYYSIVGLNDRDAADSSAMWSVSRNIGGAMGVALLSTAIQTREHHHFSVLAERITRNALNTQAAVSRATAGLGTMGQDPALAHMAALARLAQAVRHEATIMAFSDSFLLLGASTMMCLAAILILPKPEAGVVAAAVGH